MVDGCERAVAGGGLCQKHYMRERRTGRTDDVRQNARGTCSRDGCDHPHAALGLCEKHYRRARSLEMRSNRLCTRCGAPKPEGRTSYCSDACQTAARRASHILRRYGVTEEWYDDQLARQGGGCWICGATESGNGKPRLSIDHDHETGLVRGLLCAWCNRGIGYFGDNPDQMRRAIAYLEAFALDRMTAGGAT